MPTLTKVTRNFQITIPEEVRTQLNIKMGDQIVLERADFGYRLHKKVKGKLEDFIGALPSFNEKIPSTQLQRKWRQEFTKREQKLIK